MFNQIKLGSENDIIRKDVKVAIVGDGDLHERVCESKESSGPSIESSRMPEGHTIEPQIAFYQQDHVKRVAPFN